MSMRLGIMGTAGVGKTTLVNGLKSDQFFNDDKGLLKGFNFVTSFSRAAHEKGYKINENGSYETQSVIIKNYEKVVAENEFLISDRSPIDCLVYSQFLHNAGKMTDAEMEDLYIRCTNLLSKYDVIFYIPVEFEPEADGVRSINNEFYNWSTKQFAKMADYYELIKSPPVVRLSGSIEKRLQTIYGVLLNGGVD